MQDLKNWKARVITQKLLEGSQIWEYDKYVFQIEKIRGKYRVAMFVELFEVLQFVGVSEYSDEDSLLDQLHTMNMKPSNKVLTLRRREK